MKIEGRIGKVKKVDGNCKCRDLIKRLVLLGFRYCIMNLGLKDFMLVIKRERD